MLDSQDGPQGVFTGSYFPHNNHSCEEINTTAEEEELSVLPRHTKVIVTGNNRTKSVLVGLHGVVKKAVGLGGWHWLVLTNGVEVKLQRNALSVIEAPTGHEEDDLDIPFSNESAIDDFPRTFKPRVRPHKPPPPDVPKGADSPPASESPLSKRPTEKKMDPNCKASQNLQLTVDLSKLDTAALRRYRRHFKLFDVGPSSPKEQLLQAVSKHFVSHQPDEVEILTGFLQNVKRQRT